MTGERIDEILRTEEELAPSSGFVAAVMDRLREEQATPPPIPFPWRRALPGFVLSGAVFAGVAIEFARSIARTGMMLALPPLHVEMLTSPPMKQTGWVIAALVVSAASWMLARRLAR